MKEEFQKCRKEDLSEACGKHLANCQANCTTENFCISSGNLSGFADGEYLLTEQEELHLRSCPHCQRTLEDFKLLSSALHDALQEECPEEFVHIMSERVKCLIKQEEKNNRRKKRVFFSNKRTFIHAAAAVMLFSFVIFILNNDDGVETIPEESINVPQKTAAQVSRKSFQKNLSGKKVSGTVDIRNLVNVSTGTDSAPVHFLASSQAHKGQELARIGEKVKLLWVYEKGKSHITSSFIQTLLTRIAGKTAVKNNTPGKSEKSGKYSFIISTNRKNAVILVRELAAEKFRLLSPDQPQPEQKFFYGTGHEKTELFLDFLPSE